MDVLNMNDHAVHPRVIGPAGQVDTVHVMPKRRATLPEGYTVDPNWLAGAAKVSVFESRTSRVAVRTAGGVSNSVTPVARPVVEAATATVAQVLAAQKNALAQ